MIRVQELSKRYGAFQAVDDVSFAVERGEIVGFLGRNGAGKSTTLRVLAGLTRASSGTATIGGRTYRELPRPLRTVGFGLDADAFHPGISGRDALAALAVRAGIARARVRELLTMVELDAAADRRVGSYSLGMRQRLLLACAMLGDPEAIVLDEPTNGLDPQGHRWLRDFLRARASEDRAVLLSSHVLGDVGATVDRAVVLSRGRLVADAPIRDLSDAGVRVASPNALRLTAVLRGHGAEIVHRDETTLSLRGMSCAAVGELAAGAGIVLHELTADSASLEEAFFALTGADEADRR